MATRRNYGLVSEDGIKGFQRALLLDETLIELEFCAFFQQQIGQIGPVLIAYLMLAEIRYNLVIHSSQLCAHNHSIACHWIYGLVILWLVDVEVLGEIIGSLFKVSYQSPLVISTSLVQEEPRCVNPAVPVVGPVGIEPQPWLIEIVKRIIYSVVKAGAIV